MSPRLRQLYLRARSAGYTAVESRRISILLRKWESAEHAGYVRLRAEDDPDHDPRDFMEESEISESDWDAFGTISEYRTDPESDDWEHGDSCWGHVGYADVLDWRENPYILDHMRETLDSLRAARKRSVLASPVPAW